MDVARSPNRLIGGGGWESNPPLGFAEPLVLKTRGVTRLRSPPRDGAPASSVPRGPQDTGAAALRRRLHDARNWRTSPIRIVKPVASRCSMSGVTCRRVVLSTSRASAIVNRSG